MQITYKKKRYNWRQVTYHYRNEYWNWGDYNFERFQAAVLMKVYYAVKELAEKKLINGVYIMNHAGMDIRLSSTNWKKNEWEVYKVLINHGIHARQVDWNVDTIAGEGDEAFNTVDVEVLIAQTKALFTLVGEVGYVGNGNHDGWYHRRPHAWTHWMYNQYGYRNIEEASVNWDSFIDQSLVAHQVDEAVTKKALIKFFKTKRRRLRGWIWRLRKERLLSFVRRIIPKSVRMIPTRLFGVITHRPVTNSDEESTAEGRTGMTRRMK